MNLAQAILDSLQQYQAKVISRDADAELTAAQLIKAAAATAGKLTSANSSPRIGLLLPNCAAYPAALLGVIWAGKVAVPLNPMLRPPELDFLLKDGQIDTVVAAPATKPLLSGLSARTVLLADLIKPDVQIASTLTETAPEDVAVMLYTSGTSGKPKGVPLSHENLLSNAQALIARAKLTSQDVILGVLPMFHAFGLTGTLTIPFLAGAEVTYLRYSPERATAAIAERGVTMFVAVPGMFGLLARSKGPDDALRTLRYPVCGGEPLPATIREGFEKRFRRPLLEGYGLTETAPVVAVNLPGEHKPGTVGKVLSGVRVRIVDEAGRDLSTGREGEIQVRGPNVMKGYLNRPGENAVTFTRDGWFRTGDLGRIDSEGYLTVSGRIKELIIRAGEKIMPREVEETLLQCAGVAEAAVIGEPDGARGEAVVAFIVPAVHPPHEDALREHCRACLAEFKIPRRFVIAADLPRGATGKILKRALRDWKPA
jgi:long-chain acyl-CoA synthetase